MINSREGETFYCCTVGFMMVKVEEAICISDVIF